MDSLAGWLEHRYVIRQFVLPPAVTPAEAAKQTVLREAFEPVRSGLEEIASRKIVLHHSLFGDSVTFPEPLDGAVGFAITFHDKKMGWDAVQHLYVALDLINYPNGPSVSALKPGLGGGFAVGHHWSSNHDVPHFKETAFILTAESALDYFRNRINSTKLGARELGD